MSLGEAASAGAVIVSFHPQREALAELVRRYRQQLDRVVVVDNTPGGADLRSIVEGSGGDLIELGDNFGIGVALNRGIDRLIEYGCSWFVLSDQDSVPSTDLVARLMAAFVRLQERGVRVATVGASFVDPRSGHVTGFPEQNVCGNRHHLEADATGLVPASYVITSGSLVSRAALEAVGPISEALFIDYVDVEWCFRAVAKGYAVYGEPAAVMQHTLGDSTVGFWLFGKRQKSLHSPLRVYFQTRNFLLLCRLSHVAICWKFWSLTKRSAVIVFYLLVGSGRRLQYLCSAFQGVRDGLMGRTGKRV